MSGVINNYYQNGQLSFAAYAQLWTSMDPEQYRLALESIGMSENQARQFAGIDESNTFIPGQGYKIIDQYTDSISGFSATVFQNRETQEYTFAIRGTNDIVTVKGDRFIFENKRGQTAHRHHVPAALVHPCTSFIFELKKERGFDNAKAGTNYIEQYGAPYCAAWA